MPWLFSTHDTMPASWGGSLSWNNCSWKASFAGGLLSQPVKQDWTSSLMRRHSKWQQSFLADEVPLPSDQVKQRVCIEAKVLAVAELWWRSNAHNETVSDNN